MSTSMPRKASWPTGPHPHAVIEIIDASLGDVDRVDSLNKVFRIIAGSEAYRRYSWLKNIPGTNVAGNFRGMVVSARWESAYQISNKFADALESAGDLLLLASLAVNLYKNSGKIQRIRESHEPSLTKAARFSALTSSLILGTIGGIIPEGAHLLSLSLEGYLRLANVATGNRFDFSGAIRKIANIDHKVHHVYSTVSDGDRLYSAITTYLVYGSPKFLKFP